MFLSDYRFEKYFVVKDVIGSWHNVPEQFNMIQICLGILERNFIVLCLFVVVINVEAVSGICCSETISPNVIF